MAFPCWKCEKCGSTDAKLVEKPEDPLAISGRVKCQRCGHEWEDMLF